MASTLSHGQCAVCSIKENLQRCSACRVINYCGCEHQASDRSTHKKACKEIRTSREKLEKEERDLRAAPADFTLPANVFETHVGHFWGIYDTRDYMRARMAHVEALQKVKTREAVQTTLNHCMDLHRLCRSDNMGVRGLTPCLLLRLGKDQKCYDFVKWYATTGQEGDYDWGNMDLPYLDINNADVFESVDLYTREFAALSHAVAIMLLKIRLLVDLRAIQHSAIVRGKLPQELFDNVREQLVSNIIAGNKNIVRSQDLSSEIEKVETQVGELYRYIEKANKHFWPALLNPGCNLTARPSYYSQGDEGEMQVVLGYSYDAWRETPGAIDVIRERAGNSSW